MAMQRFFEFFRRKNYGAPWDNLFNFFHLDVPSSDFIFVDGNKFVWWFFWIFNQIKNNRFQRIKNFIKFMLS